MLFRRARASKATPMSLGSNAAPTVRPVQTSPVEARAAPDAGMVAFIPYYRFRVVRRTICQPGGVQWRRTRRCLLRPAT
jgi:hypothetical protein